MVSASFLPTATRNWVRGVEPKLDGPVVVPVWTTPFGSVVPTVTAMSNNPLFMVMSAASAPT